MSPKHSLTLCALCAVLWAQPQFAQAQATAPQSIEQSTAAKLLPPPERGPGHFGHGGGNFGPGFGGPGFEAAPPFLGAIELSEAQQDKVFAITHARVPAFRDFAKRMSRFHDELKALTQAPKLDEKKLRALVDAHAKDEADMTFLRATTERQIFDLLTPEQKQQVAEHANKPPMPPHHGGHPKD